MRLKDGLVTHTTGEEQMMVSVGDTAFAGIVRSNRTAAFIVDCLKVEVSQEEIVEKMLEKYDAPKELIERDVKHILGKLREAGLLHE